MKLLVGITASIGVIHFPFYLTYLREHFDEIKVIMSERSKNFVSKEVLELLNCKIYSSLFPLDAKESHVQLAAWANLFVIMPATANILAEAAHGLAGSLLSTTILCHERPVLFFPNMNEVMWKAKATQKNVALLREHEHLVFDPIEQIGLEQVSGQLKMGGYMPSPIEIVSILKTEYERRFENRYA